MTEHRVATTLVPTLLAAGILLLVLWPTRQSGSRLLRTWGLAEPADQQVSEAVGYLRRRRFLFVALVLLLPSLARLARPDADAGVPVVVVSLLVAMLLAEFAAALRPVRGVRVASLDPRGWRDLLPGWAPVATAALAGTVLLLTAAGVAVGAAPWPVGAGLLVCLVAVAAVVRLAVRRPSAADPATDTVLRVRSARVATAIGLGWLGVLVNQAHVAVSEADPPGWLATVTPVPAVAGLGAGIVCWIVLAVPTRRSLAPTG